MCLNPRQPWSPRLRAQDPSTRNGSLSLSFEVVGILLGIVGVVGVGYFIYGTYMYLTASGALNQMERGKAAGGRRRPRDLRAERDRQMMSRASSASAYGRAMSTPTPSPPKPRAWEVRAVDLGDLIPRPRRACPQSCAWSGRRRESGPRRPNDGLAEPGFY